MTYLLIIILSSNGFGGKEAVQIPMETRRLCEEARNEYADSGAHSFTSRELALEKTMCLQVRHPF